MKKTMLFSLALVLLFSLFSCGARCEPYEALSDFVKSYGVNGVIYSPSVEEGKDGFVREGLMERVYRYSGDFPESYAVMLNSCSDFGGECGVFVCPNADVLYAVEELCLERMRLLDPSGSNSLIIIDGQIIFYSTLQDKERAGRLWREIIR